jgi:hypothetical protein
LAACFVAGLGVGRERVAGFGGAAGLRVWLGSGRVAAVGAAFLGAAVLRVAVLGAGFLGTAFAGVAFLAAAGFEVAALRAGLAAGLALASGGGVGRRVLEREAGSGAAGFAFTRAGLGAAAALAAGLTRC